MTVEARPQFSPTPPRRVRLSKLENKTGSKTITATGYAQAYQMAFGRLSPYDGENASAGEKQALEQAGFKVIIVP